MYPVMLQAALMHLWFHEFDQVHVVQVEDLALLGVQDFEQQRKYDLFAINEERVEDLYQNIWILALQIRDEDR